MRIRDRSWSEPRRQAEGAGALSEREYQLVALVAQGFDNREIAEELFVSANTVKSHLHSIFNKLHVSERLEIALWKVETAARDNVFEGCDHRKERRFQIRQWARYRLLEDSPDNLGGTGIVMNLSNSGVWFATERRLSCSRPVRLFMDWPVLLNGIRPLQLAIEGRVIRTNELGVALSIAQYEFRTGPAPGGRRARAGVRRPDGGTRGWQPEAVRADDQGVTMKPADTAVADEG